MPLRNLIFIVVYSFSLFFTNAQNNNFTSSWKIPNGTFELPLKEYANITVYWGDGSATTHKNGIFPTHTYNVSGSYNIEIDVNDAAKNIGSMFLNGNHPSRTMLLDISNWGEGIWSSFFGAFFGANYLTVSATDEPNLSKTTSMFRAFQNCSSLVGTTFKNWDVSTITNMRYLFAGGSKYKNINNFMIFNGDVSGWNTANVANMRGMFGNCIAFDVGGTQSLNNWNTAAVTDMQFMFSVDVIDVLFKVNVSSWNTANVTNMMAMFQGRAAFNCDISNWSTQKVTDMSYMFFEASAFNKNINRNGNSWNTAAVTNMYRMFYSAHSFNGDITNWNTTSLLNTESMFENAFTFNQNIRRDGDIWNTAEVTNMKWMFYYAEAFNGDITNWNTAKVTDMELMFYGAKAFKEKLEIVSKSWDMKRVRNKEVNNNLFPYKGENLNKGSTKLIFKEYLNYILIYVFILIISILYLFRKNILSKYKKNSRYVFSDLILTDTWSIKPLNTDLSEIEAKISERYNKNEIIKVFHLFEQNIFKDNIFEKKGVNVKEFSRITGVPLTHCFYLLKFHITSTSFTKFKNYSRIEVAVRLIENSYLVKGTFESLSVEVGFESYSTFFNSFKVHTSLTPSEYARLNKIELI
ncbi:BspA family leucine-rich repeat surface protein [Polaribacter glomeratus]|uniref:PKD domain-containing protein n=1 Tax=Polaribacter glomeratus TaxID=102 RepID=A0A2S7WXC4_9FLAO|nr:BspA family leucine-rich repeat surface protein [Polaribacter glomeratus]PQJ82136.1 hypothetical protein BTO16_05920 [Polaribacter glomeratus]TXD66731.1 BspA family leucine-rich repeat surface protein [Polaribacter glomeratus]